MSTDFVDIRAAITTKLNSIDNFGSVKDYHTDNVDGYPAVTFEPSGNEAELFTNEDNLRRYSFDIIIHQELENIGRDEAIDILSAAVDATLTAFDADFNLGGVCDFCFALPSTWGEYTSGKAAVKYAMLTLVCNKEVPVVS
jgi:hypothetical protein